METCKLSSEPQWSRRVLRTSLIPTSPVDVITTGGGTWSLHSLWQDSVANVSSCSSSPTHCCNSELEGMGLGASAIQHSSHSSWTNLKTTTHVPVRYAKRPSVLTECLLNQLDQVKLPDTPTPHKRLKPTAQTMHRHEPNICISSYTPCLLWNILHSSPNRYQHRTASLEFNNTSYVIHTLLCPQTSDQWTPRPHNTCKIIAGISSHWMVLQRTENSLNQ